MSANGILKSTGRDYTAAEKLWAIEHEIVRRKRRHKQRPFTAGAARLVDILRAVARDYRNKPDEEVKK